ncbi:MAG: hypothetical protein AAGL49_12920 [Pseudomonadota bacterium]
MLEPDLAVLAAHIVREYPDYYGYYAEREFTWSDITQPNRNPLLYAEIGADGLKTGHTQESGYSLVGSAVRGGDRRIIVVSGLESERARAAEAKRMLSIAFNDFVKTTVVRAGDLVGEAQVWQGDAETVPLMVREDVTQILHRRSVDDVKLTVSYPGSLSAPIERDQEVAVLRIEAPGRAPVETPLVAAGSVGEMGVFGKIGMAVRQLMFAPDSAAAEGAPSESEAAGADG